MTAPAKKHVRLLAYSLRSGVAVAHELGYGGEHFRGRRTDIQVHVIHDQRSLDDAVRGYEPPVVIHQVTDPPRHLRPALQYLEDAGRITLIRGDPERP